MSAPLSQAVGASRIIEERSLGGPSGPGSGLYSAISDLLLDRNARASMRTAALAAARPDAADTIAATVLRIAAQQARGSILCVHAGPVETFFLSIKENQI